MKLTPIAALAATAIFASTLVNADSGPRLNVEPTQYPELAAAQDLARKAYFKLGEAQHTHGWDQNGHLQAAMDKLMEVNREIGATVGAR